MKPKRQTNSSARAPLGASDQFEPAPRIAATMAVNGLRIFEPHALYISVDVRMWRKTCSIWSGACEASRNTFAALATSEGDGVSLMKRRTIFAQMWRATPG